MVAMNSAAQFLLATDQKELWARLNDSAADVPDTSLHALILRQAGARPDQPAVVSARRRLSYAELAARARALAARIADLGGGAEAPVVISAEPGWEQVVAVLAALLAGAPFHPVDPQLAQPVRWHRLADTGATILLTQSWLEERLQWPDGTDRVAVDTAELADPGPAFEPAPDGGRVACILLGEGSTRPLVPMTHEALVNVIVDLNRRHGVGTADRLLALSPLGDELSVYGLVGILAAGASVVVPDDIDLRTPAAWVTLMFREEVTVWAAPPALATLLVEHLRQRGEGVPPSLRLVVFAGEPLVPSLVTSLRDLATQPLRMVNLGGALPAGLWSCGLEIGDVDARHKYVPIGAPLANQRVYVLNDAMSLCPVWVTGRLYFGGRGLTAGFWGDGSQSDDFTTLPESGERLYRSDQLGRLLPDGTIEVVGDDATRMVVQGHPMNLRDVDGTLAAHESVLGAAVVQNGAGGSVGYVKLAASARVTGAELLDHLRTRMSALLLPERIEPVAVLPLTPGGRVDRAALAAAAASAVSAEEPAPGSQWQDTELTQRACALAARVLGVPEVEPSMNLLDLGATSVQLVRLAVQAEQELGIQVDVEELLRFPAVTILVSFADAAEPAIAEPDTTEQVSVEQRVPAPLAASDELVLDPVARMDFKARQPGLRRDLDLFPGVDMARPTGDRDRLVARRTHRGFGADPVPAPDLSRLLGVLRQFRAGVEPKYAYPSAGSLYPLQTYLSVADGRVQGVPGGIYYYHPVRHRLVELASGGVVDPATHAWINRAAFRSSAFSLYLVARLAAISPMYGDRARDYCLVEAGAMCQLLMTTASDIGLGMCPVGEMDFAAVRHHFSLDEPDELVHVLLGGTAPSATAGDGGAAGEGDPAGNEAGMLARVDALTGRVADAARYRP